AVDTLGIQRIVDECELNGVQELCQQILRNPQTGEIGRILDTFLNVAQAKVEGIDTEIVYNIEPDFLDASFETFSLRALAGYIMERSDPLFGGEPFDVAGSRGTPALTCVLSATYGVGPLSFQLQARYIDSVKYNARWVEGVDVDDNTIPSSTWWNARIGYNGELANGSEWALNLNVQNIFDREPPVVPGFGSRGGGQSVDSTYDIFGRRYNLSLNYNF